VEILPDGSPGEVTLFYKGKKVLDDFSCPREGLIVTTFYKGTVFYLSAAGEVKHETPWKSFNGPSSIIQGRSPLFENGDVLVTERGMMLETRSPIGNKVSLFSPEEWFMD